MEMGQKHEIGYYYFHQIRWNILPLYTTHKITIKGAAPDMRYFQGVSSLEV